VLGVGRCDCESFGASVPYRSGGKVADMGESAFVLNPSFVGDSWFSNPRPTGCAPPASSGGGVGVRGGTGSGIPEAIVCTK
jgi:hypothetical protein